MADWIKPPFLVPGNTIGIVAPSDAVDREEMEEDLEIVKKWCLKVKMGKHVYSKVGDFYAGSAEQRIEDLKTMIYDDSVKLVWCASGGYAATEVLPIFNKETMDYLKDHPKWFLGYSDICLILNALNSFRVMNLMGPTVQGLSEWDGESQELIRKSLFGEQVSGIESTYEWRPVVPGVVDGRLIASNLEGLIFSFGTRFDPLMYGSGPVILGIEELDIEKSTLQRQIDVILSHKRSNRIAGILVGRMVNIRELSYPEWGKDFSAQDLIIARVKKWGKNKIPLAFCEDFGHAEWDYEELTDEEAEKANHKFLTIPNGTPVRFEVTETAARLLYL